MKNQTGAKYLARQKANIQTKEAVILCHVKRESELIRLVSGAVKRIRRLCD